LAFFPGAGALPPGAGAPPASAGAPPGKNDTITIVNLRPLALRPWTVPCGMKTRSPLPTSTARDPVDLAAFHSPGETSRAAEGEGRLAVGDEEDVVLAVVQLELRLLEVVLVAHDDLERCRPRLEQVGAVGPLPLQRLRELGEVRAALHEVGRGGDGRPAHRGGLAGRPARGRGLGRRRARRDERDCNEEQPGADPNHGHLAPKVARGDRGWLAARAAARS